MDLTPFMTDIDELVEAFVEIGGQELSQMKELWRSRSFSFIHEARPSNVKPAFFMQSLYSCALDSMGRTLKWSRKLGGLYVLYILYETQLWLPPYKIYLSTDDLENIQLLVKEAKAKDALTALRVVNRMMVKNVFLYGSVTVTGKKMRETYHELENKADEKLKRARDRILGSSAKGHFEGNLIKDLGLDGLAMLNEEYAMTKQRVLKGTSSSTADVNNRGSLSGEEMLNEVKLWMEKRKCFFGTNEQGSSLHGESSGTRNVSEKQSGATGSVNKEGDESIHFNGPRSQDGGSAVDINVSVEDDVEFETELENALDWD